MSKSKKRNKKVLNVTIDPDCWERLEAYRKSRRLSRSACVNQILAGTLPQNVAPKDNQQDKVLHEILANKSEDEI